LNFENGVYIANKSSVATNMCLMDGYILVDKITMGEGASLGHASLVAPGTTLAQGVAIEAFVLSGVRNKFGENAKIGDRAALDHAVRVGKNSTVGSGACLSMRVSIGDNVKIPDCAHIHTGVRIKSQADADQYVSEETGSLTRARAREMEKVDSLLAKYSSGGHAIMKE